MSVTTLKIAAEIAVGSDSTASFTPAAGEEVAIKTFFAEIPDSIDMTAKLIWKFEHGSEAEEVIWIIRRSGAMPFEHIIEGSNVDGIRKLGILIENNEATSPQGAAGCSTVWHEVK